MFKTSLLAALPLLAACAAQGSPANPLTGTSWKIISINSAAPISDRAEVEFLADRISATVGCNGLGGTWSASKGKLITGPFMSTMMYCDGLMEQERALGKLFEAQPAYVQNGDELTLSGGGQVVKLRRAG